MRSARGQALSTALMVGTGVTEHGGREILGVDVGDSEDATFWRKFLSDLKERGLSGVLLVISDQHAGLVKALNRCFVGASHQRRRVHFARDLLALVPEPHKHMVAALYSTIFAQPDADAVHKEIRRRARVVGISPNDRALIRLIGAVLADIHDEWQVADRRLPLPSLHGTAVQDQHY